MHRVLVSASMLTFAVSMGMAQSSPNYPVCQTMSLAVGEVPNNPFYATVKADAWENHPDGSRTQVDSPSRERAYWVARDSRGRVAVKRKGEIKVQAHTSDGAAVQGTEPSSQLDVCDPSTGTVTSIYYYDVFQKLTGPAGETIYVAAGQAGRQRVESQRNAHNTSIFRAYHRHVNGRQELSIETVEGIPVFRYQFTKTVGAGIKEEDISEDLESTMAIVTGDDDDLDLMHEVKLANIHRGEPFFADFNVPNGVMIDAQSLNPPLANRTQPATNPKPTPVANPPAQ